jgi:excisionase family DNA binding protein
MEERRRECSGELRRSVFLEEAARLLGVSRRTVYYRIRDGRLRTAAHPAGSQRVLVESIAALLQTAVCSWRVGSEAEALALQVQPFS